MSAILWVAERWVVVYGISQPSHFLLPHRLSEFRLGVHVVSVSSRGCESVGSQLRARLALLVSHCPVQLSHGSSRSFCLVQGSPVTVVSLVWGAEVIRGRATILAPVSTVGKPHLVVVADQGAPLWWFVSWRGLCEVAARMKVVGPPLVSHWRA